jgi:hypothetical protein
MRFRAELTRNGKTATGIRVPDEIVEALGGGKRPAVSVTLRAHTYRTTVAPMGGAFWIPVAANIREAAGVTAGETLDVEIARDDAPRRVELPDDLATALAAEPTAKAFFDGLSFTNQREFVEWITAAKRPETRADRFARTLESLREHRKLR